MPPIGRAERRRRHERARQTVNAAPFHAARLAIIKNELQRSMLSDAPSRRPKLLLLLDG